MSKEKKKNRKYYRHCGMCDEKFEQSEGLRTNYSPNGWLCPDCAFKYEQEHLHHYLEEF